MRRARKDRPRRDPGGALDGGRAMTVAHPAAGSPLPPADRIDGWLAMDGEGFVRVLSGKVELGQGIHEALTILVAEELDLPFERVRVASPDTATSRNEGTTAGSRSVQETGRTLRIVAANARLALIEAAAARLACGAADVAIDRGRLRRRSGSVGSGVDDDLAYEALVAAGAWDRPIDPDVKPKPAAARRLIGTSPARRDLVPKISGGAAFIGDIVLPLMVHGRVVRPPHPGARLEHIDRPAIRSLPGVIEVVVDGDFVGIVADHEDRAVAALAFAAGAISWHPAPERADPADPGYLLDAATQPTVVLARGGEAVRSTAVRTLEATYTRPHLAHAAVAPSCAIARYDDGGLEVWSHSQGIFRLGEAIAPVLGVDRTRVRVRHAEGPGCYGHNGADDAALDAALLARAVPGRPVRVQWTRDDEFGWEPLGSAMVVRLRAGLAAGGRVVDWRHEVWSHGHDARPGPADDRSSRLLAARHLARPFSVPPAQAPRTASSGGQRNAIPLYGFEHALVLAHHVADEPLRVSSLRSLGAHANVFAIESFVDELAAAAGRDPLEFRLDHLDDPRARDVLTTVAAMPGPLEPAGGELMVGRGLGFARYKNDAAYAAVLAEVELGTTIRVRRVWAALDAGMVVSRGGLLNQAEGGIHQAASWTLVERVRTEGGRRVSRDWETYPTLGFSSAPAVEVRLIDRPSDPPVGAGEAMAGPTSAAIANAVAAASGVRLRDLPLTSAQFIAELD
jgi:nicotinate dehydrogenase subunit B